MTTLKWLLIAGVIGYCGLLMLMYIFQRSLMYFPDSVRTPPATAGLPQAQEVILTTADGEKLVAWHAPPQGAKPLVIYFQGNAGALNLRAGRFKWLIADGTGLLALSYRGYGGSTGKPSEAGLIRDALAAHDCAIILDAPFTSTTDVGAAAYPFAPVRLLMKDRFHSDERIVRVKAPLLVLHGELDRIVPIAFGEKLFSLADDPKRMVRFPLGGHVDLDDHGAEAAVKEFLAGL
jgi:uncharacterized protein